MKKLIIGIVVLAILGVGYYAISPLFNTIEVDEGLPENILTDDGAMPSGEEKLSEEEKAAMKEEMDKVADEEPKDMDDPMPTDTVEETPTAPAPVSSSVQVTTVHPASGTVRVLATASGNVIRYEDFSTINGPNLHVYLSKDLEANDFIDLGPIKGTEGNINYDVPAGTDLTEYKYIMYWCVPFGVLFNYAELSV